MVLQCHDSAVNSAVCALQMIFHSRPIAIVLLIDMVALLMYNFSGMCVTGKAMCPACTACTPLHITCAAYLNNSMCDLLVWCRGSAVAVPQLI